MKEASGSRIFLSVKPSLQTHVGINANAFAEVLRSFATRRFVNNEQYLYHCTIVTACVALRYCALVADVAIGGEMIPHVIKSLFSADNF